MAFVPYEDAKSLGYGVGLPKSLGAHTAEQAQHASRVSLARASGAALPPPPPRTSRPNLVRQLTGGLQAIFRRMQTRTSEARVRAAMGNAAAASSGAASAAGPPHAAHHYQPSARAAQVPPAAPADTNGTQDWTRADGFLKISSSLPLLNFRYRVLRLVGEGTFSQLVVAEDTFAPSPPSQHHLAGLYGSASITVSSSPAATGLHGSPHGPTTIPRHRLVALKVMNSKYAFIGLQELDKLFLLNQRDQRAWCPIVRVQGPGAFYFQTHLVIVLELLGPALLSYMKTLPRGRVPVEQLRKIALQLVLALGYVSTAGMIHGDIKPENVLLEPKGRAVKVKLIDFGNAMTLHEAQAYYEDFEVQTLYYRAPEVVLGVKFNQQIDMWSLGCLEPATRVWLANGRTVRADELRPTDLLLGDDGRPVAIVPNTLIGTREFPMPPEPGMYPTPTAEGAQPRPAGEPVLMTPSPGWKSLRTVQSAAAAFEPLVVSEDHLVTVSQKAEDDVAGACDDTAAMLDLKAVDLEHLPNDTRRRAMRLVKHSRPIEFEPHSDWLRNAVDHTLADLRFDHDTNTVNGVDVVESHSPHMHLMARAAECARALVEPARADDERSIALRACFEPATYQDTTDSEDSASAISPPTHADLAGLPFQSQVELIAAYIVDLSSWLLGVLHTTEVEKHLAEGATTNSAVLQRARHWKDLLTRTITDDATHTPNTAIRHLLTRCSLLAPDADADSPVDPQCLLDSTLPARLGLQQSPVRVRLSFLAGAIDGGGWHTKAEDAHALATREHAFAEYLCTLLRQTGFVVPPPVRHADGAAAAAEGQEKMWHVGPILAHFDHSRRLPLACAQKRTVGVGRRASSPFLGEFRVLSTPGDATATTSDRSPVVSFQVSNASQRFLLADGSVTHNCLLVELATGKPMFNCSGNQQLLMLMQAVLGPCPVRPFVGGRFFKHHFTPHQQAELEQMEHLGNENQLIRITNIAKLLHSKDADFVSFVHGLLEYDPARRLSSHKALLHPFLSHLFPLTVILGESRPSLHSSLPLALPTPTANLVTHSVRRAAEKKAAAAVAEQLKRQQEMIAAQQAHLMHHKSTPQSQSQQSHAAYMSHVAGVPPSSLGHLSTMHVGGGGYYPPYAAPTAVKTEPHLGYSPLGHTLAAPQAHQQPGFMNQAWPHAMPALPPAVHTPLSGPFTPQTPAHPDLAPAQEDAPPPAPAAPPVSSGKRKKSADLGGSGSISKTKRARATSGSGDATSPASVLSIGASPVSSLSALGPRTRASPRRATRRSTSPGASATRASTRSAAAAAAAAAAAVAASTSAAASAQDHSDDAMPAAGEEAELAFASVARQALTRANTPISSLSALGPQSLPASPRVVHSPVPAPALPSRPTGASSRAVVVQRRGEDEEDEPPAEETLEHTPHTATRHAHVYPHTPPSSLGMLGSGSGGGRRLGLRGANAAAAAGSTSSASSEPASPLSPLGHLGLGTGTGVSSPAVSRRGPNAAALLERHLHTESPTPSPIDFAARARLDGHTAAGGGTRPNQEMQQRFYEQQMRGGEVHVAPGVADAPFMKSDPSSSSDPLLVASRPSAAPAPASSLAALAASPGPTTRASKTPHAHTATLSSRAKVSSLATLGLKAQAPQ